MRFGKLFKDILNFAERIIDNVLLAILSFIIFYFLAWIIIEEKIKK
jgi:energy-converting hydrogenase Eha subunit F